MVDLNRHLKLFLYLLFFFFCLMANTMPGWVWMSTVIIAWITFIRNYSVYTYLKKCFSSIVFHFTHIPLLFNIPFKITFYWKFHKLNNPPPPPVSIMPPFTHPLLLFTNKWCTVGINQSGLENFVCSDPGWLIHQLDVLPNGATVANTL